MFLETAHPVKFYDVVEPVIGEAIPIPEPLKPLMEKEKRSILMNADFQQLSEFLMNRKNRKNLLFSFSVMTFIKVLYHKAFPW